MTAYAVALLNDINLGPAIVEYLEKIDATLAPYSGRFLIHGGKVDYIENSWDGALVVIEFPDRDTARAWYESPAYQDIVGLRIDNTNSITFVVDYAGDDHKATDAIAV